MVNWKGDLERGQKWENVARIILESLGFRYVKRGYDSEWDIKMTYNNQPATFEIKTDFYNNQYMVIEYECNSKPSGISISKAKFWCFIFPQEWKMWMIRTRKLKILSQYGEEIAGGDYGLSKMYRFRKLDIITNFTVVQYRHIILSFQIKKAGSQDLPSFIIKEMGD